MNSHISAFPPLLEKYLRKRFKYPLERLTFLLTAKIDLHGVNCPFKQASILDAIEEVALSIVENMIKSGRIEALKEEGLGNLLSPSRLERLMEKYPEEREFFERELMKLKTMRAVRERNWEEAEKLLKALGMPRTEGEKALFIRGFSLAILVLHGAELLQFLHGKEQRSMGQ